MIADAPDIRNPEIHIRRFRNNQPGLSIDPEYALRIRSRYPSIVNGNLTTID